MWHHRRARYQALLGDGCVPGVNPCYTFSLGWTVRIETVTKSILFGREQGAAVPILSFHVITKDFPNFVERCLDTLNVFLMFACARVDPCPVRVSAQGVITLHGDWPKLTMYHNVLPASEIITISDHQSGEAIHV